VLADAGVHVSGKRLARYLAILGCLKPLEAMPRVLVPFKKNTVIEQREIGHDLVAFKVPWIFVELQISTPFYRRS
jgi:hypothetical protein